MNRINTIVLLTICSIATSINAHENSFFNNIDVPVGIAIQYTGNDNITEPIYAQLVKPGSLIPFSPGKVGIPPIKWGFCLDNIYYVENPTTEQKAHNFKKTFWKKIPITWVEETSTTKRPEKKSSKQQRPLRREKPIPAANKSLCRDRHFDIIRNKHGKIMITASLNE